MKQPISPAERTVYGYVADIRATSRSDTIIYNIVIVDLKGGEHKVRMRIPPGWLRIGMPIMGKLIRVASGRELYYVIQDMQIYEELRRPRVVKAESIRIEESVAASVGRGLLYINAAGGGSMSVPIISQTVLDKARSAQGGECYIHIAETPAGSMVVAVQTEKQRSRYEKLEKFLGWLEKDGDITPP